MKSCDRIASIKLLKQKVDLYVQLEASGSLGKEDLVKYRQALLDLDKLQRMEDGFQDIMQFAFNYFKGSESSDLLQDHTPSPPFHWELANTFREAVMSKGPSKKLIVAPRSHSKSTLISNIGICWLICYAEDVQRYYWILLGDTERTAMVQLNTVKNSIEENAKIKADFGDLTTKTWNSLEIIAGNPGHFIKVMAAGTGAALRGTRYLAHRPNLIGDDLEGPSDVSTPEQINKTLTWFDQTLTNIGSPKDSCQIIVGTVLHYQSLLATLANTRPEWDAQMYKALVNYPDNMDLWNKWSKIYHSRNEGSTPMEATRIAGDKALAFYEAHEEAMNQGATVLWPERMPLYEIMRQRTVNPYSFSTELQNEPIDTETQVFKNYTTYDPSEFNLDDLTIICGVDPSLKETKRSDPSAILTVGKSKQGIHYVLDVDCKKRAPDQIIDDLLNKAKTFNYKWVSIEAIQFQQFFADEVKKRSAIAGLYLSVREFKSTVKKEMRIASIEPLVTNGYIRFSASQLVGELGDQLRYFPKVKHDDILDCLSQIVEQDRRKSGRGSISGF
jgi:predicted phage terminase large subunit-like protein